MSSVLLVIALALLVVGLLGYALMRSTRSEILYTDNGRGSRVFRDEHRRLRAKPDRLEGTTRRASLIEYKSRSGRVYQSDVVQALVGVLAARASGINIVSAEIHTGGGCVSKIPLGDNARLEKQIDVPLYNARLVMSGGVPEATAMKVKCKHCGVPASL